MECDDTKQTPFDCPHGDRMTLKHKHEHTDCTYRYRSRQTHAHTHATLWWHADSCISELAAGRINKDKEKG